MKPNKHRLFLIAACLLAAVTWAHAQTLVNATFDNMTIGTVPSSSPTPLPGVTVTNPTTANPGTGSITVLNDGTSFGGSNYLNLTGASSSMTVNFVSNAASAVNSGILNISFNLVTTGVQGSNFFMPVQNSSGQFSADDVSDIILGSNNKLTLLGYVAPGSAPGGGSNVTIGTPLTSGVNYQIFETFNFTTGFVSVTVTNTSNSTVLGTAVATFASASNISNIQFSTSGSTGNWSVDNLLIQVPEPSAVALISLGGLSFALLRRRIKKKHAEV